MFKLFLQMIVKYFCRYFAKLKYFLLYTFFHNSKEPIMMMTNRFHNQFAVLEDSQMNKMRQMKPCRSRKRRISDFPKLSHSRITPMKDQLPYAKLIPTLTETHIKTTGTSKQTGNEYKNYQNVYCDTECDSDLDILNQVWCVEHGGYTIFESDIYSDIESDDSFVYESDSYDT